MEVIDPLPQFIPDNVLALAIRSIINKEYDSLILENPYHYRLCCGLLLILLSGWKRVRARSKYHFLDQPEKPPPEYFWMLVKYFIEPTDRSFLDAHWNPDALSSLAEDFKKKLSTLNSKLQLEFSNHPLTPPVSGTIAFNDEFLCRVSEYHNQLERPEGTYNPEEVIADPRVLALSSLPRENCPSCGVKRHVYCGSCVGTRLPLSSSVLPPRQPLPFDVLLLLHWAESLIKCTGIHSAVIATEGEREREREREVSVWRLEKLQVGEEEPEDIVRGGEGDERGSVGVEGVGGVGVGVGGVGVEGVHSLMERLARMKEEERRGKGREGEGKMETEDEDDDEAKKEGEREKENEKEKEKEKGKEVTNSNLLFRSSFSPTSTSTSTPISKAKKNQRKQAQTSSSSSPTTGQLSPLFSFSPPPASPTSLPHLDPSLLPLLPLLHPWALMAASLDSERDLILFPTEGAVPAHLFPWRGEEKGEGEGVVGGGSGLSPSTARKYRVVVIESSWNYAKSVFRRFSALRRLLGLPPLRCLTLEGAVGRYWRFHSEGHSALSTIEALAATAASAGASDQTVQDLLLLFRLQAHRVLGNDQQGHKAPRAMAVAGEGSSSWDLLTKRNKTKD